MVFFRVNDLQIYLVVKIRPIDFKTTQASISRIQAPPGFVKVSILLKPARTVRIQEANAQIETNVYIW